MKKTNFPIESPESIKASNDNFEKEFQKMLNLMTNARSIEFKIKIATEVKETIKHFDDKNFEQFINSKYQYPEKKIHKQISDLLPKEDGDKIILIKQIADNLAHASYYYAQDNIDKYAGKYGLKSPLNNKKVGGFYMKKIKDKNGDIVDYAHLLDRDMKNLIPEQFNVFSKQGYIFAWNEILKEAESILIKFTKDIGYKYNLLQIQRAYKFGVKIKNKG